MQGINTISPMKLKTEQFKQYINVTHASFAAGTDGPVDCSVEWR